MGCDIHLYAEKITFSYADTGKVKGKWVSLDKWSERDEWEDADSLYQNLEVNREDRFYTHGRNYNLFCALVGVRSGGFEPAPKIISEPKGFPKDASRMVKKQKTYDGSDGHTHSYLTLAELIAFDWSDYGETVKDFIQEVIPKLEAARRDYPHQEEKDCRTRDQVRIVFWFDN